MKRTIAAIVFVFIAASFLPYDWIASFLSAACTTTTNMSLCKPAIADTGWGANLNNNFETIDTHDHTSGKGVVITPKATGEVFHTTAASCPAGSAEYTTARGFYIVGLPSGGTSATSVGTALTNLENRAAGQHLHSVDPPSTAVVVTDPEHTHTIPARGGSAFGGAELARSDNSGTAGTPSTNSNTTGITASVDIAAFNSANGGSVVGTNAPYIHLLVCRQS
jgi:hypothetical protein